MQTLLAKIANKTFSWSIRLRKSGHEYLAGWLLEISATFYGKWYAMSERKYLRTHAEEIWK